MLDLTVRLGDILTVSAVIGGGLLVFGEIRQSLRAQETRLDGVETELKQQTVILINLGRQDQQLKDHDRRLTALEK